MKLHEALALKLSKLKVSHLFGLIGDANLFMVNHYVESNFGKYVGCTHEANAVFAAMGYSQATGNTGIATVTHGPALTNIVTALIEAVKGCIPLVVLCGDTAPAAVQHLQNVNQREIVASTGAIFVEMNSPESAIRDLERAFRLAAHHKTPVIFNMRIDMQWSDITYPNFDLPLPKVPMGAAIGEDFEEALGMLASARRPLIIAGRGAIDDDARKAIIKLAHRIEAPIGTTLKACGLFQDEAYDLGIIGNLSHPTATEIIMQSDCIIAFGASLSKATTDSGAYTKGKRIVQILADIEETPRLGNPNIRLIGDIAKTAQAMIDMLDIAEIPGSGATDDYLTERLKAEKEEFATIPAYGDTALGTVDIEPALRRLHHALPKDRILVADLGRFVKSTWRNMRVTAPKNLVLTSHFGAIGCGLGHAIGTSTSIPDRPTVLVAGDGGFLLSGLSELATAVQENANLIIILCNDGSFGAEHVQLTDRQLNPSLSMITTPNFAAIAEVMGFNALQVTDEDSLSKACDLVRQPKGQILIDLILDPTRIFK